MTKIIFSDIDKTLLNDNHQLPDDTISKVRELVDSEIPFILVSARGPKGMEPIYKELGVKCPMISFSGALVTDENGNIFSENTIPLKTVAKIHDFLKDYNVAINIYSGITWYAEDLTHPLTIEEEGVVRGKATDLSIKPLDDPVHKIMVLGDNNVLVQLETILKREFPKQSIYLSKDTIMEILPSNTSKSNAIEKLLKYYNLSREDAMAFGDSPNDKDMLEYVGCGVAVSNACQEVLDIADKITKSNQENGVLEILRQIKIG